MKLKDNSSTFLIKFLFGLLVIAFLFGTYIFLNLDTNVKEGIITSLSDNKNIYLRAPKLHNQPHHNSMCLIRIIIICLWQHTSNIL